MNSSVTFAVCKICVCVCERDDLCVCVRERESEEGGRVVVGV